MARNRVEIDRFGHEIFPLDYDVYNRVSATVDKAERVLGTSFPKIQIQVSIVTDPQVSAFQFLADGDGYVAGDPARQRLKFFLYQNNPTQFQADSSVALMERCVVEEIFLVARKEVGTAQGVSFVDGVINRGLAAAFSEKVTGRKEPCADVLSQDDLKEHADRFLAAGPSLGRRDKGLSFECSRALGYQLAKSFLDEEMRRPAWLCLHQPVAAVVAAYCKNKPFEQSPYSKPHRHLSRPVDLLCRCKEYRP